MNMRTKRITKMATLVAIGIILGYIESLINIIPISGVKIGLSNAVILYCIYNNCSYVDTLLVVALKSVLNGLLFNGIMSIIYSLSAALVSLFCMYYAYKNIKSISIYGISMLGSCSFNIVQFLVASILLNSFTIMMNLWYVLPISLITGLLLGEVFRIIFLKDS